MLHHLSIIVSVLSMYGLLYAVVTRGRLHPAPMVAALIAMLVVASTVPAPLQRPLPAAEVASVKDAADTHPALKPIVTRVLSDGEVTLEERVELLDAEGDLLDEKVARAVRRVP